MIAVFYWPGRLPGIAEKTADGHEGQVVEVWGDCQGGCGSVDGVDVRARYIMVH